MATHIKDLKLPDHPAHPMKPMEPRHVAQVHALLAVDLAKYESKYYNILLTR